MDARTVLGLAGYGLLMLAAWGFVAFQWRSRRQRPSADPAARAFLLAIIATALWGTAAVAAILTSQGVWAVVILDKLRDASWITFLLLLAPSSWIRSSSRRGPSVASVLVGALVVLAVGSSLAAVFVKAWWPVAVTSGLGIAVLGLVLLEQVFRNQAEGGRWSAKPACLGLAFNFGFDTFLFTEAVMFGRFDPDVVSLRGFVYASTIPLLYAASRRQAGWIGKLKVSRAAAFYSASLLMVGAYLLVAAGVGYYVRYFGGEWGRALQIALLFIAALGLAVLLLSGSVRAWLRVFLSKNFFSYRYDYRQEWLRATAMLSGSAAPHEVGVLVIRCLADLVECPAGSLWTRDLSGSCLVQSARWNCPASSDKEPVSSSFCALLEKQQWIVDLPEFRARPRRYGETAMPLWLLSSPTAWIVIPLLVGDDLIGFVVLDRPRTSVEPNWEVRDLLKIAARQAAGVLARLQATEALLEARKFDAFNRMSAFVVHDLKNIVTQLGLMVKNARRLGHNPEFQQDMLSTVEHSLEKMRQMMLQLREGTRPMGGVSGVDLEPLLRRLARAAEGRGRHVELEIMAGLSTRGDEQRLERVLGHIVQNALDATPASGTVCVRLQQSSGLVELVITDTGRGMSAEFIQNSLFRPFNSTKDGGMGIGAYESFQYVRELGGSIDVQSELGKGSVVTVRLPLFDARRTADLHTASEQ